MNDGERLIGNGMDDLRVVVPKIVIPKKVLGREVYFDKDLEPYVKRSLRFYGTFIENLQGPMRVTEVRIIMNPGFIDFGMIGFPPAQDIDVRGAGRLVLHLYSDLRKSFELHNGGDDLYMGAGVISEIDIQTGASKNFDLWAKGDSRPDYSKLYLKKYFKDLPGVFNYLDDARKLYEILINPEDGFAPLREIRDDDEEKILGFLASEDN